MKEQNNPSEYSSSLEFDIPKDEFHVSAVSDIVPSDSKITRPNQRRNKKTIRYLGNAIIAASAVLIFYPMLSGHGVSLFPDTAILTEETDRTEETKKDPPKNPGTKPTWPSWIIGDHTKDPEETYDIGWEDGTKETDETPGEIIVYDFADMQTIAEYLSQQDFVGLSSYLFSQRASMIERMTPYINDANIVNLTLFSDGTEMISQYIEGHSRFIMLFDYNAEYDNLGIKIALPERINDPGKTIAYYGSFSNFDYGFHSIIGEFSDDMTSRGAVTYTTTYSLNTDRPMIDIVSGNIIRGDLNGDIIGRTYENEVDLTKKYYTIEDGNASFAFTLHDHNCIYLDFIDYAEIPIGENDVKKYILDQNVEYGVQPEYPIEGFPPAYFLYFLVRLDNGQITTRGYMSFYDDAKTSLFETRYVLDYYMNYLKYRR